MTIITGLTDLRAETAVESKAMRPDERLLVWGNKALPNLKACLPQRVICLCDSILGQ